MTLYSVFIREGEAQEAMPRLVADRFSWLAALLAPLYMLVHGLWLALLGFVLVVAALAGAALWLGPDVAVWAYLLAALLFGFEAPALLRRRLARKGFVHAGERFAENRDMAAMRWLAARPASPPASPSL
jgi:hypothetical protein